jgi:hypothetical protein
MEKRVKVKILKADTEITVIEKRRCTPEEKEALLDKLTKEAKDSVLKILWIPYGEEP